MTRLLTIAALVLVNTAWAQQFHLSGTISGMADENLRLEFPEDYFGNKWAEEIPVSKASFSKNITIPSSGWMKLHYHGKDRSVYVSKNATALNIDFQSDFLDDNTEVKISGDDAAINAFAE